MKIDGNPLAQDLIQQMQEVAKRPTEEAQSSFQAPEVSGSAAGGQHEVSGLEREIHETAKLAMDGSLKDVSEVRGRVIDAVVDDKLGHLGNAKQKKNLRETLRSGLIDNPAFIKEVDQMLLLAAKEIARGN